MHEFDQPPRNPINMRALKRFESDLYHSTSFFNIQSGFIRYLSNEFDLPDDAATTLYSGVSEMLPGYDLYESDDVTAIEQMRLGLMRVALPLAEDFIEAEDTFLGWTEATALIAMDVTGDRHKLEDCISTPRGRAEFSCEHSIQCPVKVVKYSLIADALQPDFRSLDYQEDWAERKIRRSLTKLDAAQRIGALLGDEATAMRRIYLSRCRAQELPLPETSEK